MKIEVLNTVNLEFVTKPYHIKHGIEVGDFYEVLDVKDDFYGVISGFPNEYNETGLWYLHKNDVEVLEDVAPETTEQSTNLKVGDIVEIVDDSMFNIFVSFVGNGLVAKNGDKGKIVSFNENDSDMVLLDIFENTEQYIHKEDIKKVGDVLDSVVKESESGLKIGDIVEIKKGWVRLLENGKVVKGGDKAKIVGFCNVDNRMVMLDVLEESKEFIHKKHLQKVKDTPSTFILMNDAGLSLDKVNSCLDILRAEDGLDLDELDIVDELLVETLSHLRQLMNNLEKL